MMSRTHGILVLFAALVTAAAFQSAPLACPDDSYSSGVAQASAPAGNDCCDDPCPGEESGEECPPGCAECVCCPGSSAPVFSIPPAIEPSRPVDVMIRPLADRPASRLLFSIFHPPRPASC